MDALENPMLIVEPSLEVRRHTHRQRARAAAEAAAAGVLVAWGVRDLASAGRIASRVVASLQQWTPPASGCDTASSERALRAYAQRSACYAQQWLTTRVDQIAEQLGGPAMRPRVVRRFAELLAEDPRFLDSVEVVNGAVLRRFALAARPVAPAEVMGAMPQQPLARPVWPRVVRAMAPPRAAMAFAFRSVRTCFGLL